VQRRKHSERRLDERLEERPDPDEPRGILEIFPRDEDAPLAREDDSGDESDDAA
jgi:hypothetical protein